MRVTIVIEVNEALEEAAALEEIEAVLVNCGATFTWEDSDA